MNKHLSKYLTANSQHLREWVKERIHLTDQKYHVIDRDVRFIPEEYEYVNGTIDISDRGIRTINHVIYCEELVCNHNPLTELPELPGCKSLCCRNNQLTKLPKLPHCIDLRCGHNKLTQLPELPNCKILYCDNNQLTYLPELPKCIKLACFCNKIPKLDTRREQKQKGN